MLSASIFSFCFVQCSVLSSVCPLLLSYPIDFFFYCRILLFPSDPDTHPVPLRHRYHSLSNRFHHVAYIAFDCLSVNQKNCFQESESEPVLSCPPLSICIRVYIYSVFYVPLCSISYFYPVHCSLCRSSWKKDGRTPPFAHCASYIIPAVRHVI